ncbi:MAG: T9SS type A sorting domain-containing protein [Hymenobacter sp.]|nr:T9SS type A sorting domain-containing protein [Hymenobacter sp.]
MAVAALNVTEVANANAGQTAADGNAPANSAAISGSIAGLNWPAGANMWIRWRDSNETGTDALLAIDDFALSTGTTPLSNRKAAKNGAVSVFPNPATDVLSIRVNGQGTKAPVTVTDLTGRTVLSGTAAADGTFDLRGLPAGSYIVLVNDGATGSAHKVIKR